MKTYAQKQTADAIAQKLTAKTGVEYVSTEAHGKWAVITKAQDDGTDQVVLPSTALVPVDESTGQSLAPTSEVASTSVPDFTEGNAPDSKLAKHTGGALNDFVTLDIGGAYESKGYVYTPKVGKTTRWFMTKSLAGYETIHDSTGKVIGGRLTVTRKQLKTRGIVLEGLGDAAKVVKEEGQAA